jgi:hypothetical protein
MDVRRAVAALLLLGLLVSCSDDEPGSDPPEPTGSATVSSTAPVEPVIPAEARGTDEASAKVFVRYWFELFNYAVNTGDSIRLIRLSASDCVTCKAFRRNIRKAYADGGRVRAVGWTPTSIRPMGGFEDPTFVLRVRQGDEKYLDSDGDVVRHFTGGHRRMVIQLALEGSAWRVQQLDIKR